MIERGGEGRVWMELFRVAIMVHATRSVSSLLGLEACEPQPLHLA